MSLRSRAFLAGVGTGFFKANNERRERMQQRLEELANNRAEMDREHAKSEYSRTIKAAEAEKAQVQALRSAGHIDEVTGEYTDNYWRDTTMDSWDKENYASQEEFIKVYKQGKPSKFQSQYKDPAEIASKTQSIYSAIDQRKREELGRSPLTGFDTMLGNLMGGVSEGPEVTTKVPTLDANAPQQPIEMNEERGEMFRVKPEEKGPVVKAFRDAVDAETGETLGNVFEFNDGYNTSYKQRQADGSWKDVNVISRAGTEEGERTRIKTPKLNKVQEEGLVRYDRHDRVQRLATELAKNEYKGNPGDFIMRNLSVLKDVAGATIGLTGNPTEDLEAITSFLNDKISKDDLEGQMGMLDTAAIVKGDIEASTKFLVYATANMFHEGDRITVAAKETAEEVIDSIIFGTATHDARLMSLATKAQDEMSRVTMQNISSIKGDLEHPLWDYYPNIKQALSDSEKTGIDVITSVSAGLNVATQINKLQKSNTEAYKKSLENLRRGVGTTNMDALANPVFVHPKLGTPVVITYKKNEEGVYNFRLTPIK